MSNKSTGFPTKKSMPKKDVADIPQEEIDAFLTGARAEGSAVKLDGGATSTTNVNVNSVTLLIGRESVFEKNFHRQTYYVHKDIIKAIDDVARKGRKGEKTKIINDALQTYLETRHDVRTKGFV